MFLIYGTKEAKIETHEDKVSLCKNCKQNAIKLEVNRKYFHFFWIPVFPFGKKGISAFCQNCDSWYPYNNRFNYFLTITKTPLYFYSGIISLILFIAFLIPLRQEIQKEKVEFVKNPVIGDIYCIRRDLTNQKFYFFLRIIDIKKDSITLFRNQKNYSKYPIKLDEEDYFIAQEVHMSRDDFLKLLEVGEINSVIRGTEIDNSFLRIKIPDKIEQKYISIPEQKKTKTWKILTSLKFSIYYNEKIDDVVFEPKFNKEIKSLNGTFILLKGYVYAIDKDKILLSYTPYHYKSCCTMPFGAESIIEIPKPSNFDFKETTTCLVRGKLKINYSDHLKLPYELIDLECLECEN